MFTACISKCPRCGYPVKGPRQLRCPRCLTPLIGTCNDRCRGCIHCQLAFEKKTTKI
ncbi:hypothetical protein MOTE_08140 [Moorella thermoacetica]|uniref:Uncharacterized protein n=1 Tax=Neomoorella thermoacetica TaxID=1525 RepID=A0A1J5NQ75_NEOTH|nr:hypothetical protein MOTE_08140 [Moorella thermoacetica]